MKKLLLALSVILVVVVLWLGISLKNREEMSPPSSFPSIPLGLKGPAKALAQSGSTFPSEEAGLAAYLRVSPLDMKKAATGFDRLHRLGGNWLVGVVPVTVYPTWDVHTTKTIEVRVYIDSQGWVVAYLVGDADAAMMVWTGVNIDAPILTAIDTTALEEALKKVVLSAEVDFTPLQGQVCYYHFRYPDANSMTLAVKIVKGTVQTTSGAMSRMVVEGSTVYRESYSTIVSPASYGDNNAVFTIIGLPQNNAPYGCCWSLDSYPFLFHPTLNGFKFEIFSLKEGQVGGLAAAVVYKTP